LGALCYKADESADESKKFKKLNKNRVVADETTPNILSRIFGTCYKIDPPAILVS
jgi:hypothetical protein